jgi:hypothetical protein
VNEKKYDLNKVLKIQLAFRKFKFTKQNKNKNINIEVKNSLLKNLNNNEIFRQISNMMLSCLTLFKNTIKADKCKILTNQ